AGGYVAGGEIGLCQLQRRNLGAVLGVRGVEVVFDVLVDDPTQRQAHGMQVGATLGTELATVRRVYGNLGGNHRLPRHAGVVETTHVTILRLRQARNTGV